MLFSHKTKLFHKNYSLTVDKTCLCFRLLAPTLEKAVTCSPKTFLSTDSCLGTTINHNKKNFKVTHEVFLHSNDSLWKGGSHLLIFGTNDSLIRGEVFIDRAENVNRTLVEVFVEIIVAENKQDMTLVDYLLSVDSSGNIISNLVGKKLIECSDFGISFSATIPKEVSKLGGTSFQIQAQSPSGFPINGTIVFEALAGFLPERRIEFEDGKATMIVLSLFAPKEVCVQHENFVITIPVTSHNP